MADRHDITIAKLEAATQLTLKMKVPAISQLGKEVLENFEQAWQVVEACVPGDP